MTEVPNTILWIATACLILLTILVSILMVMGIVVATRFKRLVERVDALAEKAGEAADTVVSTFGNTIVRSLSALGILRGFGSRGRGKRK